MDEELQKLISELHEPHVTIDLDIIVHEGKGLNLNSIIRKEMFITIPLSGYLIIDLNSAATELEIRSARELVGKIERGEIESVRHTEE